MLRMVHLHILPGVLLTACVIFVCVSTAKADPTGFAGGKQIYSNRPIGYTVPTPYYGTPMAPRFIVPPVAPVVPFRVQAARVNVLEPVAVAPIAVLPPAPQAVKEATFVLRELPPEVNVHDELDAFYARLAKIQLEKRRLAEALALLENIKSETFKVRTLVDLAEYVSRDRTYQSEAEELYRLALAAMQALDRKQPVRIDTNVRVGVPAVALFPPPVVEVEQPHVQVGPSETIAPPPQPIPIPIPIDEDPPPELGGSGVTTISPPLDLPSDSAERGGNVRHPPPEPPNGREIDGIVSIPPGIESQLSSPPELAPPVNGTPPEDGTGLIPIYPPNTTTPDVDPPPGSSSDETVVPPDYGDFVPARPTISLEGDAPLETQPSTVVRPETEAATPSPLPPRGGRRLVIPLVIPDEN